MSHERLLMRYSAAAMGDGLHRARRGPGHVVLFAHPAGAQANVQVVWSHKTAKYKFLDFGSPGIRMGDHLEAPRSSS